jgi:hypothetical protein
MSERGEPGDNDDDVPPPPLRAELQIPQAAIDRYEASEAKNYRLEKAALFVQVLTLLAIVIYACITYGQLVQMVRATNATKAAADAAAAQAETARRNLDLLIATEKASLALERATLDLQQSRALVDLTNTGRLTANIVYFNTIISRGRRGGTPTVDKLAGSGGTLSTGKTFQVDVPLHRLTDFEKREILAGGVILAVGLRAYYQDGVTGPATSTFCLEYHAATTTWANCPIERFEDFRLK